MQAISKKQMFLYGFLSLLAAFSIPLGSTGLYMFLYWLHTSVGIESLYWFFEDYNRFDFIRCILMIPVTFFMYRHMKKAPEKQGIFWSMPRGLVLGVVAGIGFGGISYLWIAFAREWLWGFDFVKSSIESMGSGVENYTLFSGLLAVVVAGILGPISEEILFRGIIFHLLERIKGGWFPVIGSALLFGVAHMGFAQSVYTCIMGMIAGMIYYKTRNLLWPIIIHITINVFATLSSLAQIQPYIPFWQGITVGMILPLLWILYRTIQADKTKMLSPVGE